jgi:hypothetical protein
LKKNKIWMSKSDAPREPEFTGTNHGAILCHKYSVSRQNRGPGAVS